MNLRDDPSLRLATSDRGARLRWARPGACPRTNAVGAGGGAVGRREGVEVLREMKKLLLATRGKVLTLQKMNQLVDHTRLATLCSRSRIGPRS